MRLIDANECAFTIYVARVTQNAADALTWHDGYWIEEPDDSLNWLTLETIRYHALMAPYTDSERVLLRVE